MIAFGGVSSGEVALLRGEGKDAVELDAVCDDSFRHLDPVVAHLAPVESLELLLRQLDQHPVRPLGLGAPRAPARCSGRRCARTARRRRVRTPSREPCSPDRSTSAAATPPAAPEPAPAPHAQASRRSKPGSQASHTRTPRALPVDGLVGVIGPGRGRRGVGRHAGRGHRRGAAGQPKQSAAYGSSVTSNDPARICATSAFEARARRGKRGLVEDLDHRLVGPLEEHVGGPHSLPSPAAPDDRQRIDGTLRRISLTQRRPLRRTRPCRS